MRKVAAVLMLFGIGLAIWALALSMPAVRRAVHAPCYLFKPLPDITAHEVAIVVANTTGYLGSLICFRSVEQFNALGEVRRHFASE